MRDQSWTACGFLAEAGVGVISVELLSTSGYVARVALLFTPEKAEKLRDWLALWHRGIGEMAELELIGDAIITFGSLTTDSVYFRCHRDGNRAITYLGELHTRALRYALISFVEASR